MKKKKSDESIIAIEINKELLSITQIDNNKKEKVIKGFHSIKTPINLFTGSKISNKDLLETSFRNLLDGIELSHNQVYLTVPEDNVIKQTFNISNQLLEHEIEDYIDENFRRLTDNLDSENFYYDFYVNREIDENKSEIIIYLVRKTEIDIITESLSSVGLNVVYIDIDSFALERFVSRDNLFKDDDSNLIIGYFQLNNENTKISFYKKGKRIYSITSEDYSLKNIKENKVEKSNNDESEGFSLGKTSEIVEEVIKEDMTDSAKDFIEFINYNILLIDSHGDNGKFKIYVTVNEKELDFTFASIEAELHNVSISTSLPLAGYELSESVDEKLINSSSEYLTTTIGLAVKHIKSDSKVNLYNWRGELKEFQNKKYQKILAFFAIVSGLIILVSHFNINKGIKQQKIRNDTIISTINIDKENKPFIEEQKSKKELIINKINTINNLQVERPQIVHVFTSMVASTPKEVYLTSFKRTYMKNIVIMGKSTEEKKIFEMINLLENSDWFYDVKISRINNSATDNKNDPLYKAEYDFEIHMKEINLIHKNKKVAKDE